MFRCSCSRVPAHQQPPIHIIVAAGATAVLVATGAGALLVFVIMRRRRPISDALIGGSKCVFGLLAFEVGCDLLVLFR